MYTPKHFQPHELVAKSIYDKYTDKKQIFALFEEDFLRTIDLIREWAGVGLTINNWFWKGARTQCGYRPKESTFGAPRSAHKPDLPKRKACAADIISPKMNTKQMWAIIDKNADKLPCKIRIERTSGGKPITWLHIDTNAAKTQKEKVYYFNA